MFSRFLCRPTDFQFIDEINGPTPSLLSIYNVFIIPLLNPDGYQYAQTEVRRKIFRFVKIVVLQLFSETNVAKEPFAQRLPVPVQLELYRCRSEQELRLSLDG